MTVVGVICEYNPFHLGHEKQYRQIRQRLGADAAIVCVMSGNFVQRGEPAVFDKMTRAAAAVSCGASLVLELPVTYALRSAEGFARGGVEILSALGVVDALCFGCESGDGAALLAAARSMTDEAYDRRLQTLMADGLPYPAARQAALDENAALLRAPNDILAVEYCKAILDTNSTLRPEAFLREGGYHDATPDPENPSATAVRALLKTGGSWRDYVPQATVPFCEAASIHAPEYGERAMLARLRGMTKEEWERAAHGSEGLWSKVWKAALMESSVEAILTAAKSRRYPRTRLQRLLLCAYLGIDAEALRAPAPYVRVLGFDEKGQALLKRMERAIPLIHAGQTPEDRVYWELEQRCAGLYGLFGAEHAGSGGAISEKNIVFRAKN